jgi:hypothetical protein
MAGSVVGIGVSDLLMPHLVEHWRKIYSNMGMVGKVQQAPYRSAPTLFGIFRIRTSP